MLNKKRIIFIFFLLLLGNVSIVRSQGTEIDKALLLEIAEKCSAAQSRAIENFYKDNPAIEKKIKTLLEKIKNKAEINKYQIKEEFGAPKAIIQKETNSEGFWYIYEIEHVSGRNAVFDYIILEVSINKDSSLVEGCSVHAQPVILSS